MASTPDVVATRQGDFADYVLFADRVVHVHLREGLNIDASTGERGIAELEGFVGPGPHLVVVDGRDLGYIGPDGREALHATIGSDRIATALVADSRVKEYLARKFVGAAEKPIDSNIFFDLDEALAWAHERMAEPQDERRGT